MIIRDVPYKDVISKLKKAGYATRFYGKVGTETASGVEIFVMLEQREKPEENIDAKYSILEQILEKKPSDLMIADFQTCQIRLMALKSVLAAEKRKKNYVEAGDNTACNCCD
jgi:predicted DNA-binding WGR domain protein